MSRARDADRPAVRSALARRARAVRLVALDVDGVLTDGRIYIGPQGEAMKAFDVRDGLGLELLREAGIALAIVTGRSSPIVTRRAAELGITLVLQGRRDKLAGLREVLATTGLEPSQVAYVGDDWPDLPAMALAGLAATVADAAPEVRACAHWVAQARGGRGAVREFAQFLLQAQDRLASLLERRLALPLPPVAEDAPALARTGTRKRTPGAAPALAATPASQPAAKPSVKAASKPASRKTGGKQGRKAPARRPVAPRPAGARR